MNVLLNGHDGRVGMVLMPALEAAGHTLVWENDAADAMVDFTVPHVAVDHIRAALAARVPCVVGTSGWDTSGIHEEALAAGVPVFFVPNFALGAVLMMRFAAEAAPYFEAAEIVELHHATKLDAPSGTAKATAELMGGNVPIHSVRLPGLVAHQEVLLGTAGQVLTIRHDATSREAYVPGVLLALDRLDRLPPGLTVGLEAVPVELREERVAAGGVELSLLRPAAPDDLISEEAFVRDEFLPYWAELWPAALALCEALPSDLSGRRVVEVGCGLGVPSLVAAARGADVTATDWSADAVALLAQNAARNGLRLTATTRDWREPWDETFDLALAADVLYELRNVEPLAALLPRLAPEALVGLGGRAYEQWFLAVVEHVRVADRVVLVTRRTILP